MSSRAAWQPRDQISFVLCSRRAKSTSDAPRWMQGDVIPHVENKISGQPVDKPDHVRNFRHGQGKIDLDLHRGSRLPAYCTAMGKLLLAHLPKDEQQERIARIESLARRGPNTITSKSALRRELEQVLDADLAISNEELAPGLRAISAPVSDEAGEVVAAVAVEAHSATISLDGLVNALGPHLLSTADQISAHLGYRRDGETPGSDPRRSVTTA